MNGSRQETFQKTTSINLINDQLWPNSVYFQTMHLAETFVKNEEKNAR